MKHAELWAIVHNIADSLASGIGLMIGVYEMDVFGEAARSPDGVLCVDFLHGTVTEGEASASLMHAISLYCDALKNRCAGAGGSLDDLRGASVRYWSDYFGRHYTVAIEDAAGRRSKTEYAGIPGKRVRIKDQLGRIRPKPSVYQ